MSRANMAQKSTYSEPKALTVTLSTYSDPGALTFCFEL